MTESTAPTGADVPSTSGGAPRRERLQVTFVPGNVWRVGLVLLAVVAFGLILQFLIEDGGSVIFTVLMSWFAAIAMGPVVDRLARRMRRGVATILVMLAFVLFVVVFVAAFGALLADQLSQLIARIPDLVDSAIAWVNSTFSMSLTLDAILSSIGAGNLDFGSIASKVGLNVLGLLGSVLGSIFGLFTFGLFTFYFSAQMPQLQRWVAGLFPARTQGVVLNVWTITAQKTGGYVGARVLLGAINAFTSGIVFFAIGLPYWLPLALWTGIVAQFVPTIGTYIAIVLPVLVGLLSENPWTGVIALGWALLYQQVENLTIEPKISAKAVDVNPAVSFGAVLLGAALFGVAGAFLAVPVVAMMLALLDIYGKRYELASESLVVADPVAEQPAGAAAEEPA
ncbi:MAG: AI-2E family transporter [Actinomycetales bacterium]|nr:AI-2E family transporter [Actinomycetales bacterium]